MDNYQQPQFPQGESIPDGSNILKLQIDVEEAMQKFEMEVLRGLKVFVDYEKGEKKYVEIAPGTKPLCNNLGIKEILSRMRGRVTTIARLTYKTDEEIYKDMYQFHMSIVELFCKRCDVWEMDEELVKPIIDAAIELVQDIVFSARKGFTAINIRSSYQRSEVEKVGNDSTQPKSFLGIKI